MLTRSSLELKKHLLLEVKFHVSGTVDLQFTMHHNNGQAQVV